MPEQSESGGDLNFKDFHQENAMTGEFGIGNYGDSALNYCSN